MNRKVLIFISAGVLLLFIGGVIGFSISFASREEDEGGEKELIISADKELIHFNEIFNLSVENAPEDANITWLYGDGSTGYGTNCTYCYRISDTYEIRAIGRWDGGYGEGTYKIFACVDDIHYEDSQKNMLDLRPRYVTYKWDEMMFYYCGAGGPIVSVNLDVESATGRMEVEMILWEWGEGFASGSGLYQESFLEANSDFTVSEEFSDLEMKPSIHPYSIEVRLIIYEGYIGSYDITIDAMYPRPAVDTEPEPE